MAKKPPPVRPEAELETLLTAALTHAFRGMPSARFQNQKRFKVRLGHDEHEVDGERIWEAEGRADILVTCEGRPLAMVEVKREDQTLTDADRRQGQSYANQLTPRPPLVIVSNGRTTQVFDSSTGESFDPGDAAEEAIKKLFENAAKVAAAGLEWAVGALMGPEAGVWTSAVRTRTLKLIEQSSGALGESNKVFVRDLLFPRRATADVLRAFREGTKVVLVSGSPIAGKSHILREFAESTAKSDEIAVFMIRGGGGGPGLFQRIANAFSSALEWAVEPGDVRQWLRRMSEFSTGPALVLAIDGLTAGTAVAADLEELAETGFGTRLRILASVDNIRPLLVGANGRQQTALSTIAKEIEVGPLDNEEFEAAKAELAKHRVLFLPGSNFSPEYRAPWVLRSLAARVVSSPRHGDESLAAAMPPSIGVDFVLFARSRLTGYPEAQRGYRLLARDAIADVEQASPELTLARAHSSIVRRDVLSSESRDEIHQLIESGWLTVYRHAGGEDVVAPRAPELFLSELTDAVSTELESRVATDPREAGHWLADRLDAFFLGDLAGAQAIIDMANRRREFSSGLIEGLLEQEGCGHGDGDDCETLDPRHAKRRDSIENADKVRDNVAALELRAAHANLANIRRALARPAPGPRP